MTKQTEPDKPGAQLLKEAKSKERETNMKNFMNNPKATAAKHVILTLLTLAVIAGLILTGWVLRGNYEKDINAHIETQAKVLSASAEAPKVEASK